MVLRSLLLTFLPAAFCLLPGRILAQTFSGTVTSEATQQGVPFVNIGLPRRGLGTVSDEQGHYRLAYNAAYATDTVRISSVGFRAQLVPFAALLAAPAIRLVPEEVALNEVSVTAAGAYRRTHTVGLDKPSSHLNFHMMSNELGTEIGTIVHLDRHPALVQSLHVAVVKNEAGPLTFRLNLYRLDAKGVPTTEKLMAHDVFVTAQPQAGVLSVDLGANRVVLDQDFLLALEWVKAPQGAPEADFTKRIGFGGALKAGGLQLYMRRTSQAAWIKPTFKSNVPLLGLRPALALYTTVKD
ncbi:carboxypeptidase-like regulatory domain-containing protein [Hymenobacter convexus]|uniref:carboxypeptidase-like regulatory domain-containing protein n=1 Tax=Hymenobacter sp. CA1UV-4 TaxID=3063782 RepID=UPI0027139144|nr:carboxypeptidase-like regulatory domain-containing protein [Hymenobacter sp. CA1UV-4]MDO7852837.1 carboxypeptidase-like regulatory domain-containing protein [Hymenobacter sp. CA1UV-4]